MNLSSQGVPYNGKKSIFFSQGLPDLIYIKRLKIKKYK